MTRFVPRLPVAIGEDFNLVRYVLEKSKNKQSINMNLMVTFNNWEVDLELMELQRVGTSITWTNKQLDPTWCVLDRVLVSLEWES